MSIPFATPNNPPRALALPVILLMIAAYLLPGLVGHDPWKPDEPYVFGAVRDMMAGRDWVVPLVGGMPFVEKPPLYYWAASATTWIGRPWLPDHDGARLASGVFTLLALLATAGAARLCWGKGWGRWGAILFMAALGLESHAQRMLPDLALMTGLAIATLGFAAIARDRRWGGAMAGIGVGIGFLAKGLIAPGVVAVSALLMPVLFREWRSRFFVRSLAVAALVSFPFLVVWPTALYLRSEALFMEWLWDNNIGRFLGFSVHKLGASTEPGFWRETFAYFLFPLPVYAAIALIAGRREALRLPGIQVGLALAGVFGLVLVASASARAQYALPMIAPVALVAIGGLASAPRWVDRPLAWISMAIGAASIALLWFLWLDLALTGSAPSWRMLEKYLPLAYEIPSMRLAVAAAALMTAGFLALAIGWRSLGAAGIVLWTSCLIVAWGLGNTLLLPWIDYAKSFRAPFTSLAAALPAGTRCIVMDGPGESERAMIAYFTGVAPRRRFDAEDECGALVWMGNGLNPHEDPGPGWVRAPWEGNRPGEPVEKFQLYLRRQR